MNKNLISRWLCCAALAAGTSLPAITPAGVQTALDKGGKAVFIDVRPLSEYKAGHIPNAIHIPSQLVPAKDLPPLGRVIVYDDGLGLDLATAAATALNQKSGINAEALQGGYAAWLDNSGGTTQPRGVTPSNPNYITYDNLKKIQSSDVVLVDLRHAASASSRIASTNKLTNLAAEFPQARLTTSPASFARQALASKTPPPLLVLIDDADGTAQETARTLRANGNHRFVILAGGEKILARHGQSGMDRIGSTITSRSSGTTNAIIK